MGKEELVNIFMSISNAYMVPSVKEAMDEALKYVELDTAKTALYRKNVFERHDWERLETGEIDQNAYEDGFHNGPVCKRCGKSFCVHCTGDFAKAINETCVEEFYLCPNCGRRVEKKDHHCRCGQRLNWKTNKE